MAWSKNNYAHTILWSLVRFDHKDTIEQTGFQTFAQGGEWKNSHVIRSTGVSKKMTNDKANAYATKLDEMMRGIFGVKYEEDSNAAIAISAVAAALATPNSKLKDVGDVVDAHYVFRSEM